MGFLKRSGLASVALIAGLSGAAGARASVVVSTAGGMTVSAVACASITRFDLGPCVHDVERVSFTGQPTALSVSATAKASGGAVASASMTVDARSSWNSPDSGTADINSLSSLFQSGETIGAGYETLEGPALFYAFTPTQDAVFSFSAVIDRFTEGSPTGLRVVDLELYAPGFYYGRRYSRGVSEDFNLKAGLEYQFLVTPLVYDLGFKPHARDAFELNTAHIAFNITAAPTLPPPDPDPTGGVPEPATWAMMIAGFGMAGGALRRRRAPPAARFVAPGALLGARRLVRRRGGRVASEQGDRRSCP